MPDHDLFGEGGTEPVAVNDPRPPMSAGRFYAEELMPILSPGRRPPNIPRDIAIVRKLLEREKPEDIVMAVKEVRRQCNFGKLTGWLKPGEPFTMVALLARSTGLDTFRRFLHEARKREASKKVKVGQSVADIFATIAARGTAR